MNNYQLLSQLLSHLQPLLPLAGSAILLNLALTVWHWQVGVKSDTYFRFPNGEWLPLSTLKPKKGERLYILTNLLDQNT